MNENFPNPRTATLCDSSWGYVLWLQASLAQLGWISLIVKRGLWSRLECASRLEHVGLNKYFWHIYNVTMTCFTTRHIQRGGGGGEGTIFQLWGRQN